MKTAIRKILCLPAAAAALFLSGNANAEAAVQADTSMFSALGKKLDEYVERIEPLDIAAQKEECDFLISSCRDSLARQYTALKLYSRYMNSKVMGVEAVAIYLADTWFIPGKIRMRTGIDLMNAQIFADFNRQSLVGMKAPALKLRSHEGGETELFKGNSRKRSVLYFYDTGCANCLAQSVLLRTMLDNSSFDVELDAVYTGADSTAWTAYIHDRLSPANAAVHVNHLWDPAVDSDFQRRYGVLQTPRMFLIDRDGTIMGRGLDVPALATLLEQAEAYDRYDYGSPESAAIYDRLTASPDASCTSEDLKELSDRIAQSCGNDRQAFRETIGDLMYYLASKADGRYKEAEKYLCDKYILSRPDIWYSPHDSLAVVGFARVMSDLLSRAAPGSTVSGVNVYGTLAGRHVPENLPARLKNIRKFDLGRLRRKETFVMFFDKDCAVCREYLDAADKLLHADRKMRILFVRMSDGIQKEETRLLDTFDLSTLPFAVKIGRNGRVLERYVDFRKTAADGKR